MIFYTRRSKQLATTAATTTTSIFFPKLYKKKTSAVLKRFYFYAQFCFIISDLVNGLATIKRVAEKAIASIANVSATIQAENTVTPIYSLEVAI